MSTSVTSSIAAAAPSAGSSSCATADFTKFPSTDIFCAVGSTAGVPSDTSSILSKCCKSAPVQQFNGQCGYYCLAYQQSVADLTKCFQDGGVAANSIFCSGPNTATATGTPTATPSGGRPSGIAGTTTGAHSAGKTNAASPMTVPQTVSKAGFGMLGMIVISMFAGTML